MKYIYYITALACWSLCLIACNDEWKDELYTQMISLKAPIDAEDVSSIYLRYHPNGEVTYKLPVLVSGSTINDQAYDVRIGVDNDTLAILNEKRFGIREDLYFKQLPESFFNLPSPSCHIPAGSNQELFEINFNLKGINLVDKWVLPMTILNDPLYLTNDFKGRKKALLHLKVFNDYSGLYSSTGMNIYFGNETANPTVQGTREARVVDENTIFFYAGLTEEKAIDRELYKIFVKFEPPTPAGENNLTVWAANDTIKFEMVGKPTYEVKEEMDDVKPYLKYRYTTLRMEYKYLDVSSSSQLALPYRCTGSMLLQRNINILIPDEDQAIQW